MKNHYSLNPGEFFVAEEVLKHRRDLDLCIPMKDHGWDLLAVNEDGTKTVRIQVKESRVYARGTSWYQLRTEKLNDADIFAFVSYVPIGNDSRIVFAKDYIVVPRKELVDICKVKKPSKGKYSFYFGKKGNQYLELRDGEIDVSEFRSAWHLI